MLGTLSSEALDIASNAASERKLLRTIHKHGQNVNEMLLLLLHFPTNISSEFFSFFHFTVLTRLGVLSPKLFNFNIIPKIFSFS